MIDQLDEKTDNELDALFGREVADLGIIESHWGDEVGNDVYGYRPHGSDPRTTPWANVPNYCSNANAVLPWLEKESAWASTRRNDGQYSVWIEYPGKTTEGVGLGKMTLSFCKAEGKASTFPRAAALALLRAKRGEKKP